MVLGLAVYGRSFILKSSNKGFKVGAPAFGNGFKGKFTKLNGLLSYYEICELTQSDATWTQEWDQRANVPYMYSEENNQWISYDNEKSLRKKVLKPFFFHF